MAHHAGARIVLTAPLTESIDHVGFFINPLGTTFAAGVYASIFGSSREPVNALYARRMFDTIKAWRQQHRFAVILGGSGAWQIEETGTEAEFGIDTVVRGRAESAEVIGLFERTGRIYDTRPLPRVTRDQLLAAVRPDWREAIADARASTPAARARVLRMTVV
jgi:hypothetical protein